MATFRKRFGGKIRFGTRKAGTTFNLGRTRKQKIPKVGVPKIRLKATGAARVRGGRVFRGRRPSIAGMGGLIAVLLVFGLIGHFFH